MKARLILLAGLLLAACQRETHPQAIPARIILDPGIPLTRATDPDEQLISAYNLLIFNAFGVLEEKVYIPRRKMVFSGGKLVHETTLLLDVPYSIYAVANLGYELPCRTLEEVRSYRYHLAYPDEYSRGIPMAGKLEEEAVGHSGTLTLPLERLMARDGIGREAALARIRSQLPAAEKARRADVVIDTSGSIGYTKSLVPPLVQQELAKEGSVLGSAATAETHGAL